jgi:septal ring factor EnvC (AmiA/AmiB activator)
MATDGELNDIQHQLLVAQRDKVIAEIAVLRRTTPITEAIKIFGSTVLGLGGAMAAIAGFQLAEVKAEKFALEASAAETARDQAKAEIDSLRQARDQLEKESADLASRLEQAKIDYESIADKIAHLQKEAKNATVSASLDDLSQKVNAADMQLRAPTVRAKFHVSGESLDTLIERLFAPSAAQRGSSYEELLTRYATHPEFVPRLLRYAEAHIDNQAGVYNALSALNTLDAQTLKPYQESIRSLVARSRVAGRPSAEKGAHLLERLER